MSNPEIVEQEIIKEKIVIQARDLTLYHPRGVAFAGINLAIPAGAVVGLVGRNGAGKSSLLQCLVGLREPDRGSASLFGCPSLQLSDAVRERLGYVAQSADVFEWMTAYDHLCEIGKAYARWDEHRCMQLALRMNLPMTTPVGKLSGGDQQKLSFVLALAHDPDLLILDEPVSNLDPISRREFMLAMFGDLRSEQAAERERTVLISSHLLSDLERVVSHLAFLRDGHLQAFDSWDAMLEFYRQVPDTDEIDASAIISRHPKNQTCIIDTRLQPELAVHGKALMLDELFLELNA